MSVFSKPWFALTASFPILEFYLRGNHFYYKHDREYVMEIFFKHVAYPHLLEPTEVDILDRCLGLILKKGVWVLEIDILNYAEDFPVYHLSDILLSAYTLTSLTIQWCELPSSFMVDGVEFKSLKLLSLAFVPIDEGVIKYLTTGCPLLEEINLYLCHGLKRFCVYGHQNLQKVQLRNMNEIERINIEAPNLCYLLLMTDKRNTTSSLNLASCKKLKTSCYSGCLSKIFTDVLSSFPFIENLFVCLPSHCNNLKLSTIFEEIGTRIEL